MVYNYALPPSSCTPSTGGPSALSLWATTSRLPRTKRLSSNPRHHDGIVSWGQKNILPAEDNRNLVETPSGWAPHLLQDDPRSNPGALRDQHDVVERIEQRQRRGRPGYQGAQVPGVAKHSARDPWSSRYLHPWSARLIERLSRRRGFRGQARREPRCHRHKGRASGARRSRLPDLPPARARNRAHPRPPQRKSLPSTAASACSRSPKGIRRPSSSPMAASISLPWQRDGALPLISTSLSKTSALARQAGGMSFHFADGQPRQGRCPSPWSPMASCGSSLPPRLILEPGAVLGIPAIPCEKLW